MHNSLTNTINIFIDDTNYTVKQSDLLIDILLDNDLKIAHFCYHKALGADGNCRMCMVKIEGQKRPQIACDTYPKEGMKVYTNSEDISEVKRSILELELVNHPVDCPVCDQAGECKLQDYYMDFGLYNSRVSTTKTHKNKAVDLGSNVMLDQERCVLCARCTRFTQEITKTAELAIIGRGDHACVSTAPGKKLDNPYAMNVIDLCPVGALTSKDFRFKKRVWFLDSVASICHGCSKGCNIYVDHNQDKYSDEKVYRFRPRVNVEVNGHFICDEGRLSYTHQNSAKTEHSNQHGTLLDSEIFTQYQLQITRHEKKVMLASPSLSLEQYVALIEYCKINSIKLFSLPYHDEHFGDDFLRKNDRSANKASLELLNINQDKNTFFQVIEEADLIINIDHHLLFESEFQNKTIHITSSKFAQESSALLNIAMASYAYDSGTLISFENKKQRFSRSIYTSNSVLTLLELLHKFDKTIADNDESIWEQFNISDLLGCSFSSLNSRVKHLPNLGVNHA